MGLLALRSVAVLTVLFALLFAVATLAMYLLEAPVWLAVVVAVVIMGLQYLISPWIIQLIFKIRWQRLEELPGYLRAFLEEQAAAHRIPVPRFGIIEDGNPNAFTFGHYPGDARIAITRGLLDMCDEEEVRAVVGHEIGHIVHWDFVIMTIASTIVLVLYYLYVFGRRASQRRGRSAGAAAAVALSAFLAYILAEYVALFLSRVREYYADRYSAETTGKPNALASALMKIAYGLARSGAAAGVTASEGDHETTQARLSPMRGFRTVGIFDPKMGASLALAAAGSYAGRTRTYDPEVMVKAMEWDLFNPWAFLCELHSSHPLPAKRMRALARVAEYMGQAPAFSFPNKPSESYWDEFLTDILVYYLPVLGLLGGVAAGVALMLPGMSEGNPHAALIAVGAALLGLGLGLAIRLRFMYPGGNFADDTVANLVSQVKVSAIRCVPARLQGTVIGRGIPGLYWSDDLVLEDGTGFMVLDYRQPLPLFEVLFGWLRAEKFIGQSVVATGWYRRFPRPFLEIWQFTTADGKTNTCWAWPLKKVGVGILVAAGLALLLAGLLLAA
ncbi:MAG: M48 family metalloprotease [Armatimonadetes bacterium]|nr:M48 family metalloprotease [Armatimonadota bacterium]